MLLTNKEDYKYYGGRKTCCRRMLEGLNDFEREMYRPSVKVLCEEEEDN